MKHKAARLHYTKLSLEQLVFDRLVDAAKRTKSNGRIMRFPLVFSRICPIYCLTKSQAWDVLHSLRDLGWIEIVPYQGIRLIRPSIAKQA